MRLAAVAAIVLAVGLAAVGRIEAKHQTAVERAGIAKVRAAIPDLREATRYRWTPEYACLDYGGASNPVALELCFDRSGRVLEAADRRTQDVRAYSLRLDPTAPTIRLGNVRRTTLRRLQEKAARQIWSTALADAHNCHLRTTALAGEATGGASSVGQTCTDAATRTRANAELAATSGLPRLAHAAAQLTSQVQAYAAAAAAYGATPDAPKLRRKIAVLDARVAALDREVRSAYSLP